MYLDIINSVIKKYKSVVITDVDEWHVWFKTKKYRCEICKPHKGTNFKWMFRKGKLKAFDRWANSTTIEQFYDSLDELLFKIK